jgi:hypothetical protein
MRWRSPGPLASMAKVKHFHFGKKRKNKWVKWLEIGNWPSSPFYRHFYRSSSIQVQYRATGSVLCTSCLPSSVLHVKKKTRPPFLLCSVTGKWCIIIIIHTTCDIQKLVSVELGRVRRKKKCFFLSRSFLLKNKLKHCFDWFFKKKIQFYLKKQVKKYGL